MLDYSEVVNRYLHSAEEKQKAEKQFVIDKIKLRQDRLTNKRKQIEELQYEEQLILGNLIATINQDLRNSAWNLFRYFEPGIFWKAWRWNQHKDSVDKDFADKDIDEQEYNSYKSAFGYTKDTIQRVFFGEEFKDKANFKEIIMNWEIGYDYIFTCKRQEIHIFIPTFNCTDKTYTYELNGYHFSYKDSNISTTWVCHNLDYQVVADRLQEWLRDEEWHTLKKKYVDKKLAETQNS